MVEEKDYGFQQFNAADLLKRNTVIQVFKTLDDACKKQESISDVSFETSFTKRVDLVEGFLWKYTPTELRVVIDKLRKELETKIKTIDDSDLNEKNKLVNKQKISYDYNTEIFKVLAVILTNSPISVEYVEMDVSGDFKELIKNIRQPDAVKLFTEVE